MAELRSFIFNRPAQPQTMCYLGTWIRGRLPRSNMAAQVIEISPGLDIEPLTDVALKSTEVQAGILVVERQFGYLEIHSRSTAAVVSAGAAVLDALAATPQDAVRRSSSLRVLSRVDPRVLITAQDRSSTHRAKRCRPGDHRPRTRSWRPRGEGCAAQGRDYRRSAPGRVT